MALSKKTKVVLIIAAVIGLIGAVYYYQQKKKKDADSVGVDENGNIITKMPPPAKKDALLRKLA